MDKDRANKLINEKSPYLLQHAYNPVNWYPWGDEAFLRAKEENKPVFLSIGYSTCHWCHVMEKESFEDNEVADLMNKYFISIKVDREERPDIDSIYMTVCQMLTGGGGWPLTVLLTPDKEPFFAGTYFPKETVTGRAGMLELIPKAAEAWKDKNKEILRSAAEISQSLDKAHLQAPVGDINQNISERAYSALLQSFDKQYGGFHGAPKFPVPHNLLFLLRFGKRTGNDTAIEMAAGSLRAMQRGGIYDHIGYGFHRYSTDQFWRVPHFEKMLYDQAMIALAYAEAYLITGDDSLKRTAEEVINYVLRDMRDESGGFYSAEDADSDGIEGKFYIWQDNEINEILGNDAGFFREYFNINENGNFNDPMGHMPENGNIVFRNLSINEIAAEENATKDEILAKLETIRKKLYEHREKRNRPHLDDKIMTDWNGLMITAMAFAGRIFGRTDFTEAAEQAASFILQELYQNGQLLHRYRGGEAGINAMIDDYAFLIRGMIELYMATFDADHLEKAISLTDEALRLFWDDEKGGFYFTSTEAERLISRRKELYDSAIPSGNSFMQYNLRMLHLLTGGGKYLKLAEEQVKYFSGTILQAPGAFTFFLAGLEFAFGSSREIVLCGNPDDETLRKMLDIINSNYLPGTVVINKPDDDSKITELAPFTKEQKQIDGKPTVYICTNFACSAPLTDPAELLSSL